MRSERVVDRAAHFCLALLACALPWDLFQRIPHTPLTVVKTAGGLVVVLGLVRLAQHRGRNFPRTGLEWPVMLFGIACAISTMFSVALTESAKQLALLSAYAAFIFCSAIFLKSQSQSRVYLGLYYASTVSVAVATLVCKAGVLWPADWKPTVFPYGGSVVELHRAGGVLRMTAASPDLNQGALLLAIAFACGLFLWDWARMGWVVRLALICGQVVLFAALLISQSRSGSAAAGGLAIAALAGLLFRHSTRSGMLFIVACGVAAVAIALLPPVREWVLREDSTISARAAAYEAALHLAPDHLLTGVGLNASNQAIANSRFGPQVDGNAIHSVPLKLLLETGALGLTAYAALWITFGVVVGRTALRSADAQLRRLATAALACAFVVGCMQLVQPFTALPVYPFLLAIALGPIAAVRGQGALQAAATRGIDPGFARDEFVERHTLITASIATIVVLALVAFNQWNYQRNLPRVAAFSGALAEGAQQLRAGRWEEAEQAIERAVVIARGAGDGSSLHELPFYDVMARVADADHAYRLLNIGISEPNPQAAALYAAGALAVTRGILAEAETALQEALAADWNFAQGHFVLAEVYRARGERTMALTEYKTAAQIAQSWRNRPFRERMQIIDARIEALRDSDDATDQLERKYWLERRGEARVE